MIRAGTGNNRRRRVKSPSDSPNELDHASKKRKNIPTSDNYIFFKIAVAIGRKF